MGVFEINDNALMFSLYVASVPHGSLGLRVVAFFPRGSAIFRLIAFWEEIKWTSLVSLEFA